MATKSLRELAEMRTGYPFRGAPDRAPADGCLLVQAGNIDGQIGELIGSPVRVVSPSNVREHVLHYGDVLLVARGSRNDAATFTWSAGETIAAAHLIILRPRGELAFPDYLTWFLNLPETQRKIRAIRSESTVPFVAVEALARFRVPVPSLELQNKIAGLHKLCVQEESLLNRLRQRRRVLVDGVLKGAMRREGGSCRS